MRKLRENMASTILQAAPKPIPLNMTECLAIADAILNNYNVEEKDHDK